MFNKCLIKPLLHGVQHKCLINVGLRTNKSDKVAIYSRYGSHTHLLSAVHRFVFHSVFVYCKYVICIGTLPKPIENACQRTTYTPYQCNNVHSLYIFWHQTSVIALNREWFFLECLKHKAWDNGKSSWVPALQALWREGRRRLRHLHSQPAGVRHIYSFNKYLNSIDPSPKMKGRGKHGLRNCRSWATLSSKTFSSLSTSKVFDFS